MGFKKDYPDYTNSRLKFVEDIGQPTFDELSREFTRISEGVLDILESMETIEKIPYLNPSYLIMEEEYKDFLIALQYYIENQRKKEVINEQVNRS